MLGNLLEARPEIFRFLAGLVSCCSVLVVGRVFLFAQQSSLLPTDSRTLHGIAPTNSISAFKGKKRPLVAQMTHSNVPTWFFLSCCHQLGSNHPILPKDHLVKSVTLSTQARPRTFQNLVALSNHPSLRAHGRTPHHPTPHR